MALPQIISRNQQQVSNKRSIIETDVLQPTTYYTCPTGKVAVIKGGWRCSDTGAASVVDLNAGGESIAEVQATGGGTDVNFPQNLLEGLFFPFEVTLAAGDTLDVSQDSGTNAATFITAIVEEFNI